MKKILLPLAGVAALVAFSNANAATGEELFKSKPCVACHKVDAQLVGPAFTAVAAKHAGDANAVATVASHIKNGSSGVYGPIPMPPNPVTEEEAKILAEWVLSHK